MKKRRTERPRQAPRPNRGRSGQTATDRPLARLTDRQRWPRRWWWPIIDLKKLPASEDDWKREHDEVSTTIRRVMITLIGYSFFCLRTLAAPDERLISKGATIRIPFAGTDVDYGAFLFIGPKKNCR